MRAYEAKKGRPMPLGQPLEVDSPCRNPLGGEWASAAVDPACGPVFVQTRRVRTAPSNMLHPMTNYFGMRSLLPSLRVSSWEAGDAERVQRHSSSGSVRSASLAT